MASERISPGTVLIERDNTFRRPPLGEVGGVFIGQTVKGEAFVPTDVSSFQDFQQKFGGVTDKSYMPFAVQSYLRNANKATVVKLLGTSGYKVKAPVAIVATGSFGAKLISLLHPTHIVSSADTVAAFQTTTIASNTSGSFVIRISGSHTTDSDFTSKNGTAYSCSLNGNSANFIGNVFGYSPESIEPCYNYVLFSNNASASLAADPSATIYIQTGSQATPPFDFTDEYSHATSPWVTSQKVNGNITYNLFRFHTIAHGTSTNHEVKVLISDIQPAGTVAGSKYGSFTVTIRAVDQDNIYNSPYNYDDSDQRPNVLEVYANVNLDPNSTNYIGKRIGTKYKTVDSEGVLTVQGEYSNRSAYVRVEMHDSVEKAAYSPNLVPFGFRALYSPIPTGFTRPASASFVQTQTIGGIYNYKACFGFDFENTDNLNYLRPLPVASFLNTGSNVDFYLGNFNQHADAGYPASAPYSGSIDLSTSTTADSRKFIIPFQGGFDGWKPNRKINKGSDITSANTQGLDCSTTTAAGTLLYIRAMDVLSNKDEFQFNLVVTPGLIKDKHSAAVTYVKDIVEDRGDALYILDCTGLDGSVADAVASVEGFDSNYCTTYYPWIKIENTDTGKPLWVPPSVVLPSVFAFTSKVANPWNAPAGFLRGGLTDVIEPYTTLTDAKREALYKARINPIAKFPGANVVVWGQKTLQAKPSALDRNNVRMLLIYAKYFIDNVARSIVFEQNISVTRNRFLSIVNPFMDSIQQKGGLYAFKVVMDESNNTNDIIDQNIIYGAIYLQPSKTGEIVIIEFNLQPTGANFDNL